MWRREADKGVAALFDVRAKERGACCETRKDAAERKPDKAELSEFKAVLGKALTNKRINLASNRVGVLDHIRLGLRALHGARGEAHQPRVAELEMGANQPCVMHAAAQAVDEDDNMSGRS